MDILRQLSSWLESRPMVLLSFEQGFAEALRETRRGFSHFTLARPRDALRRVNAPTLCLTEMEEQEDNWCYVGVIAAKAPVSTFDSRLTLEMLTPLALESLDALADEITDRRMQTLFRGKLRRSAFATPLSPKLSSHLIALLWADDANKPGLGLAASRLPEFMGAGRLQAEQRDAIQLALAAFGLSKTTIPEKATVSQDSDSSIAFLAAHVLEDNVIQLDATVVPGFSVVHRDCTGHAVFRNGDQRLDIYTANRGPLEEMLGVDLIYVNSTLGNIIMVQYKMLEEAGDSGGGSTDWVFRPDAQLQAEMSRMRLPQLSGALDDYRLNPSPFFFKFVRRRQRSGPLQSFILAQEHLTKSLTSPQVNGPRGGVRLSYKALNGIHLREADLIGLIRSGYIGTHRAQSGALAPIIREVARGDRALVVAWQGRIMQQELS